MIDQAEDFVDLYDNAPCGYISLSPNSHIAMVNKTLADWLKSSRENLIGHTVHDILSFGGKIAYETHLAPILRLRGSVQEIALDLIDSAGEKIPVLVNAAEKRDSDDQLLFTRLTLLKAVDRRTFERSLIEAKAKAEERSKIEHRAIELRDQFIAVLGHDLRNPIAALAAGVGMLQRSDNLTDQEQTIVREMSKSVGRTNKLIDDVLDLARGKLGGKFLVDFQCDQDLHSILEIIVNEIRAVASDREFVVEISVEHLVDCDPDRIAQLASNLLANAVKHGARDAPVTFTAITTTEEFTVSVANGGESITDLARDSLFQPFVRGDSARAKQGLGLGLFIVNEIANAHSGHMMVDSMDGETRFTFQMPRKALSSSNNEPL